MWEVIKVKLYREPYSVYPASVTVLSWGSMGCRALWLGGQRRGLVSSVRVMGKLIYLERCI